MIKTVFLLVLLTASIISCNSSDNSGNPAPGPNGSPTPLPAPTATPPVVIEPPALPTPTELCAGLVQDRAHRPMTVLPKPALGQAIVDPQFGTTIRRITAVPLSEGENAVIKPMYSTMPAWNADESKLILWHRNRGHELYDGKTYQYIKTLAIAPTDIEQVLWDPIEPDFLFYPTNHNAIPNLMIHHVPSNTSYVLKNFQGAPTNCPVDWGKLLKLGSDPQYMSYGRDSVVGLQCGDTKFVYSILQDRVLAVGSLATTPNAPIVAPSGNLVFFEGHVFTNAFTYLWSLGMVDPYNHASIGRSATGQDTYNAVAFDDAQNGTLVHFNLNTRVRKIIIGPSTGYPYPPGGNHFSTVALRNPGWVAVSIVGDPAFTGLLHQELVLANTDTDTVCRIGHHRSKAGTTAGGRWGYWAEPHNVISPSGTRILFASDWHNGDSVDTYVVELPSYVP